MKTILKQTIPASPLDFFHNPYPLYDRFRSIHPIHWGNLLKQPGWYVTGYEEAKMILKDTRFINRIPLPLASKKYDELKNIQNDMMLFKNQPDHKRLRFLVSNVFTPKTVDQLRPYIKQTVNELLVSFQNKKTMDIVSDFAFPLASQIIAKILGVPREDRYRFREWASSSIQTIDFTRSRKVLDNGNAEMLIIRNYFKELIMKRKVRPEQDLISLLIKEEQQGDRLTDDELLAACILLVIAGHETTVNLISNSMLVLLKHPQQMMELKENPLLMERAVEEFLRYESPTQMTARVASEDIEIKKKKINKGDQVYILLGAANRDPKQFHEPYLLDIKREPNQHLAFGYGSHFCLGAPLARLEAQIALQSLSAWKDNLQLSDPEVQWRKLIGFRSLKELNITFD
ncbi:cytochrome P450 [Bacillus salipaludis]|uniref:Cytochrome P450 n=1 Tax=Bacillus salipaludis TaxID=2547811 RepID=A0AA90TVT7_9BACI|nr:cytochrome P450 [Bacillus salipaludis]MDQ6597568.1 cytochrome P450 [Bacillus salipaludis]